MGRRWILGLALATVTLAVYAQTAGFEFVSFDDGHYVTRNHHVNRGFTERGVAWAFVAGNENWHPLTWLSHMLDVQLFGLDPAGHHATAVALHVVNTLLLFGLLQSMTGARGRSAFVAGLFALHPLHVESVAWVSERKDVLSTAFGLLSTWLYLNYSRRGCAGHYLGAVALFAMALMAKSMWVTLPLVFLLLDYWPLGRMGSSPSNAAGDGAHSTTGAAARTSVRKLLIEKIPFFALSAAASVATYSFQRDYGTLGRVETLSIWDRGANGLVSAALYLGKTVWPVNLSVHYPHPYVPGTGGTPYEGWQVAVAAALLVAISASLWRTHGAPYARVGWLWYLGTLVPVIGVVQVGTQGMADRYTYLPLIGVFIALAWGALDLGRRAGLRGKTLERVAGGGAVLVLAACTACTASQLRHWRDSERLFGHALDLNPNDSKIHLDLGFALQSQGRIVEAIAHYRRALETRPEFALAHLNWGTALAWDGQLEGAVDQYRRALVVEPDYAHAHLNLGGALQALGRIDEAIASLERALALRPNDAIAWVNLGSAFRERGDPEAAMGHYRHALEVWPDHVPAHAELAATLRMLGQRDGAVGQYRKWLEAHPENADAHVNLGGILFSMGRIEEAIAHYRRALAAEPDSAVAHYSLGNALGSKGQLREAVAHFRRTLEIRPDYLDARNNLELALRLQAGEARAQWSQRQRSASVEVGP